MDWLTFTVKVIEALAFLSRPVLTFVAFWLLLKKVILPLLERLQYEDIIEMIKAIIIKLLGKK